MLPLIEPLPPGSTSLPIARALQRRPGFVWLDSARQVGDYGRYSFCACEPYLTLQGKGETYRLQGHEDRSFRGNPFDLLQELLARYQTPPVSAPFPFHGGAIGALAYELGQHLEQLPATAQDDLGGPDLWLGFYDAFAAFDHHTGEGWLCATGQPATGAAAEQRARERLAALREWLQAPPAPREEGPASTGEMARNLSREAYLAAVAQVKEYIAAGDIYQANFTQRFEARLQVTPWELYLRLRETNPAPFAAYLDLGEMQIVSASPERFLQVQGREVQTRPIKGTRPRGQTPAEDEALAAELLGSVKDNAELLMIVDLERNDVGRVCEIGSVRVPELPVLESYPTVHHLVATIEGRLAPERGLVDLLTATFPGGSITGAPKIRSMEIIDELEPTCRSFYTGSIGYLGADGHLDLSIVIRTILCHEERACFQVGGGIVADSSPEGEYQESLDKGRALARALDIPPEVFDA
jgi:para-aminobenzoate synthetase component 1